MQTHGSGSAATRAAALRSPRLCSIALGLLCTTFAHAQQKAAPPALPKHLVIAQGLLAEVSPENASYTHKNNFVQRKTADAPAACHADCSGLVNWLLLEAEGQPEGDLKKWLSAKRPVARHYHDAIIAENNFRRIHRLGDCLPGDIVAMKYPEDNDNTGHVMIVADPPKKRTATAPLVPEIEQWEVKIIDSTRSPHAADSRRPKNGPPREGIGVGLFRIYANAQGEPVGYTWGLSARSEYRPMAERSLVIGRFQPRGNDAPNPSVKKVGSNAVPPPLFINRGQ